jgi:glycosyltransferase involved in cell wall biosynthesis
MDGARRPVVLGPSVDIDLFRPGPRAFEAGPRPVRVSAMVRPATLHRAPARTMDVLAALKTRFGDRVEIATFGADDAQLAHLGLVAPGVVNLGRLGRVQVAGLLERSDVFLDLSDYQAMGLTALEAMASGCAVALPMDGGTGDFARDEENALLVDTWSDEACLAAAERLVADHALRAALQAQAAQDACAYPPETAAFRLMDALFGS